MEWIDCNERQPTKYDRYLVCRKDGKWHIETWNGTGWAYNHKVITHWLKVELPKKDNFLLSMLLNIKKNVTK